VNLAFDITRSVPPKPFGYRAFFNMASEGILLLAFPKPLPVAAGPDEVLALGYRTGIVADCNPAMAAMRGYASPNDMIGLTLAEIGGAYQESGVRDWFAGFLANGCRVTGVRFMTLHRNGARFPTIVNMVGGVSDGMLQALWISQRDVSLRERAEEAASRLAAAQLKLIESERSRIAREIHDELGQWLTVLGMDLAMQERRLGGEGWEEIQSSLKQLHAAVHRIATELRPAILDQLGLSAAIEWHLSEFARRTGIRVRSAVPDQGQLDPDAATAVFRILQESLTNVARHARATQVEVTLQPSAGSIGLQVRDDGIGIEDPEEALHRSLGLLGMRERARQAGGSFTLESAPGKGAVVRVEVPREAAAS
jgi:signal transduction histidine kinase